MDKKKKQILIGAGILIVVGVVGFIVWYAAKKKREKAEKEAQAQEENKLTDTMLEEINTAASKEMELRPMPVTEPVTEEPATTTDPLVRPLNIADLKPTPISQINLARR